MPDYESRSLLAAASGKAPTARPSRPNVADGGYRAAGKRPVTTNDSRGSRRERSRRPGLRRRGRAALAFPCGAKWGFSCRRAIRGPIYPLRPTGDEGAKAGHFSTTAACSLERRPATRSLEGIIPRFLRQPAPGRPTSISATSTARPGRGLSESHRRSLRERLPRARTSSARASTSTVLHAPRRPVRTSAARRPASSKASKAKRAWPRDQAAVPGPSKAFFRKGRPSSTTSRRLPAFTHIIDRRRGTGFKSMGVAAPTRRNPRGRRPATGPKLYNPLRPTSNRPGTGRGCPLGITVRAMIDKHGGGPGSGRNRKAKGCIPPAAISMGIHGPRAEFDTPLELQRPPASVGLPSGLGPPPAVIVLRRTRRASWNVLYNSLPGFFAHEFRAASVPRAARGHRAGCSRSWTGSRPAAPAAWKTWPILDEGGGKSIGIIPGYGRSAGLAGRRRLAGEKNAVQKVFAPELEAYIKARQEESARAGGPGKGALISGFVVLAFRREPKGRARPAPNDRGVQRDVTQVSAGHCSRLVDPESWSTSR